MTDLQSLKQFFDSGATRPYAFRKRQLQSLRTAIKRNEKAIAEALKQDLGKSAEESWVSETGLVMADINYAISHLREWMAPRRTPTNLANFPSSSFIYRDPLGVVFIIAPWNYPFQLLMIPLIGAIAGGNTVVVKPSEHAPATEKLIAALIRENFEPDYIRCETGEGKSVVGRLIDDFRFDYIFYTGSIAVGKSIYEKAASQLIPVTLELGGKSPAIVESDAQLRKAARRITVGKFLNAGQTCIAPDYVLVQQQAKQKFLEEMIQAIADFYSRQPSKSQEYGRIINQHRFDRLTSLLDGARVIHGAEIDRAALYFSPTIVEIPNLEHPLMHEEIFGPILPVIPFGSSEEAINIVNRNANPLALYLFTSSTEKKKKWLSTPFGGGCINNADWHFANHHLPFGGVGNSGMGQYHGKFSFDTFTRMKSVLKTPTWIDFAFKYPPLKGRLGLYKIFFR